jgi:hypothetical protein
MGLASLCSAEPIVSIVKIKSPIRYRELFFCLLKLLKAELSTLSKQKSPIASRPGF